MAPREYQGILRSQNAPNTGIRLKHSSRLYKHAGKSQVHGTDGAIAQTKRECTCVRIGMNRAESQHVLAAATANTFQYETIQGQRRALPIARDEKMNKERSASKCGKTEHVLVLATSLNWTGTQRHSSIQAPILHRDPLWREQAVSPRLCTKKAQMQRRPDSRNCHR